MSQEVSSSRRKVLKTAAVGAAVASTACVNRPSPLIRNDQFFDDMPNSFSDSWSNSLDRVWLSGDVWANPMEDWSIKDGAAQVGNAGGNRSIHCLTHEVQDTSEGDFVIQIDVDRLGLVGPDDGGAGIRVGVSNETGDYRSHCFEAGGLIAGWRNDSLVLGSLETKLDSATSLTTLRLILTGRPTLDSRVEIKLEALSNERTVGQLSSIVSTSSCAGNVALVSNFDHPAHDHGQEREDDIGAYYRFSNWHMAGAAFAVDEGRRFGPILWTMYTLNNVSNRRTLKLSALIGPMSSDATHFLSLEVKHDGDWHKLAVEKVNQDGWLATFTIENWRHIEEIPYRVVYDEPRRNGQTLTNTFDGLIRSEPEAGNLTMAALTCQNDYAFPYAPLANNVVKMNPDMLFFSGDQIYENHGGFGFIREPSERSILNYLRKFYQFGWAFREAMRDRPTICLPDDHDVLQGNLWGEGGAKMQNVSSDPGASILGGYVEPVRVINAVHRTCVSHHPDPIEPTPLDRGISVYYTTLNFGQVSFAILADRQWKSGPERINVEVGKTGEGEAPDYFNPDYDNDSLVLLGERQEQFLSKWASDWRGHQLKAVLSQTIFAGLATHQPTPDRYLKYDFDSSGWPASARNNAIEIMRESKALHICGDTHLGSLSQYGVHQQRDSNWAFCTPAIAAGWPRWWHPDSISLPIKNRPKHGHSDTGEYRDAFGNKVYVYAVANPKVGKSKHRYVKAHEKGSGFGFVEFNTRALTYTLSAIPFLADLDGSTRGHNFKGWPVTIHRDENSGTNKIS